MRGRQRFLGLGVMVLGMLTLDPAYGLDPERGVYQYSLRSWSIEDGLPQNTVQAITQTPEGYIWLATNGGLVRSDGVRFKVFDRSDTEAMASAIINDLTVDADGALWLATNDGLVRYVDGVFHRWEDGLDNSTRRVLRVLAVRDGGVLFGTYGGAGYLRDGRVKRWGVEHGLLDNSVWSIAETSDETVWLGTYVGGLFRTQGDAFVQQPLVGKPIRQGIKALCVDAEGNLWAGSSNGLHRLRGGESRLFTTRDGLTHNYVRAVIQDRQGNLWVGTFGGGLHRLQQDAKTGEVRIAHYDDQGMGDARVISLFEDREGNLWFGTQGRGLHMLSEGAFRTYELIDGTADQQATSIYQDQENNLWIALHSEGIRMLGADGSRRHFAPGKDLPALHLWAVYGDRHGDLWIGTSGEGLLRFRDGRFTRYTVADGLPHDVVFGLHEARDGGLWISTNGGLGLLREDRLESWSTHDGLSSNLIRALLEDGEGNLWVGTSGGGLNRLRDGEIEHFGVADGLGGSNIWSIYEDRRGHLWFGTSGGLSLWRDGRFRNLDSRSGLRQDNISIVLEDAQANLWLGTKSGVVRLERQQLDDFIAGRRDSVLSLVYGEADGLRNAEILGGIQPAAWRATDGRLWFPTPAGVAMVDPAQITDRPVGPPVRIEGVRAGGVEVPLDGDLALAAGTRRFEVDFTALSFHSPHTLSFRHRLDGYDAAWVEVGGRRQAVYTNLPPGSYTFRVSARNQDGHWSPETRLELGIRPFFYQTRPFIALCVLFAVLAAIGLYRLRIRQHERRQRELEQRVDAAVAEVRVLSGLLPICCSCKKIRDDEGYWEQIEHYLAIRSDVQFSHGLCPDCFVESMAEAEKVVASSRG